MSARGDGGRGRDGMNGDRLQFTYIGGPTALLELGGVRILTDPTFDPAGESYPTPAYTLRKTTGPALAAAELGPIDAVLLSHDHHSDNLDRAGRAALASAGTILTTTAGAGRLGGRAVGLAPWQTVELRAGNGRVVHVTGTPARHGPAGGDRGPVTGFVLRRAGQTTGGVYISGDTVWYEGVAETARRFPVRVVVLFMGAARVPEVGPANLTFTAGEAVEAARAFREATIVPAHYEGWAHYSESQDTIERSFVRAGLQDRLRFVAAGAMQEFAA